jgi:hypothetical protein
VNKINRIVFLVRALFNLRDYERFGIDLLEKNGFIVEVWDFTPFLEPTIEVEARVPNPLGFKGYRLFKEKKDGVDALKKLTRQCFVVCLLRYEIETFSIYRTLSSRGVTYSIFLSNEIPATTSPRSLRTRLRGISPSTILNSLFIRISPKYLGVRPASVVLAGGEKSISPNYFVDRKTNILWLHSMDYDLWLDKKEESAAVANHFGVFLDSYLPFHPDILSTGGDCPASRKTTIPSCVVSLTC